MRGLRNLVSQEKSKIDLNQLQQTIQKTENEIKEKTDLFINQLNSQVKTLPTIEEHELPVMVWHFRQLKELLSAIVTVMEMGEKKGNWKPSQVKAAIDQIKVGQSSCSLSRTFMTSPGGRQMALDAEASTKKTSQDTGSDLLLKKAIEGQNLKLLPLTQLERVSSDDYHAEYLQANLTLGMCGQILNTISQRHQS